MPTETAGETHCVSARAPATVGIIERPAHLSILWNNSNPAVIQEVRTFA